MQLARCSVLCSVLSLLAGVPASALNAQDIQRAHTPKSGDVCGGDSLRFPPAVLASCTEPIPAGTVDMRGVYTATLGSGRAALTLTERIEQCGTRFVVSGPVPSGHQFIHDFPAADQTLANGVDDWNAASFPSCARICASGKINATCMEMWYDRGCTDGADGTGLELGARRCKQPDGTIEFWNEQLAGQNGGAPVSYAPSTVGAAESAMVESHEVYKRMRVFRIVLPILLAVAGTGVLACCLGCVWCYKRKKCCFGKPRDFGEQHA